MEEQIGPKLNESNILTCNGCKEFNTHPYYGDICRLGYSTPEQLQFLKSINSTSNNLCPFYKDIIEKNKLIK